MSSTHTVVVVPEVYCWVMIVLLLSLLTCTSPAGKSNTLPEGGWSAASCTDATWHDGTAALQCNQAWPHL